MKELFAKRASFRQAFNPRGTWENVLYETPFLLQGRNFRDAKHFSDYTIICRGQRFPVHRIIVARASDYFDDACKGPFTESDKAEVTLDDPTPAVMDALIQYMYSGERLIGDVSTNEEPIIQLKKLPQLCDIYVAADEYQVRGLPQATIKSIHGTLIRRIPGGLEYNIDEPISNPLSFDDLLLLVQYVYNLTRSGSPLREMILITAMTTELAVMWKLDGLEEFLITFPEFLFDLTTHMVKETEPDLSVCCKKPLAKVLIREGCQHTERRPCKLHDRKQQIMRTYWPRPVVESRGFGRSNKVLICDCEPEVTETDVDSRYDAIPPSSLPGTSTSGQSDEGA